MNLKLRYFICILTKKAHSFLPQRNLLSSIFFKNTNPLRLYFVSHIWKNQKYFSFFLTLLQENNNTSTNVNRPSTSTQPIGQCWERVTLEKSGPPTRSTHSLFTMAGMQAQCYLILQIFKRSLTYRILLKIHSLKSFSNNSKNCKNLARVITVENKTHIIGASCSMGVITLRLWG